jgi:hypothetical protein
MNKIAKFMNGEIIHQCIEQTPHGSCHDYISIMWKIPDNIPFQDRNLAKIGLFKYDSDWNWLMPVIEKIENIILKDGSYFQFSITNTFCSFTHKNNQNMSIILRSETGAKTKITATYECVLAFIDYYNSLALS